MARLLIHLSHCVYIQDKRINIAQLPAERSKARYALTSTAVVLRMININSDASTRRTNTDTQQNTHCTLKYAPVRDVSKRSLCLLHS